MARAPLARQREASGISAVTQIAAGHAIDLLAHRAGIAIDVDIAHLITTHARKRRSAPGPQPNTVVLLQRRRLAMAAMHEQCRRTFGPFSR
jgi:hypothetical protein